MEIALLVQVEPAPSTVDGAGRAGLDGDVDPKSLLTVAPLLMVSVPLPSLADMPRSPLMVQVEPAPSTVAAPTPPGAKPI